MKCILVLLSLLSLFQLKIRAQDEIHSTMFMMNKLLFNPAYAGSRDLTTINADYRNQWSAIKGAPTTLSAAVDGPVGNYNNYFREVAVGLSISSEQIGVETKQIFTGYYAYRIRLKNESILSFGLDGSAMLYSANYSLLDPYQPNDPNLARNIKSIMLPNFGAGLFWYSENYYLGLAVPNLMQDYYDLSEKKINNLASREVRGYYLNGGYVFHVDEAFDLLPQFMARYIGNGTYQLPFNCDLNVSGIIAKKFLFGATYRTDKSFEAIVQMQVTRNIFVGYAYDYLISALNGYNNGAHELIVGYDFVRGEARNEPPHFAKLF